MSLPWLALVRSAHSFTALARMYRILLLADSTREVLPYVALELLALRTALVCQVAFIRMAVATCGVVLIQMLFTPQQRPPPQVSKGTWDAMTLVQQHLQAVAAR